MIIFVRGEMEKKLKIKNWQLNILDNTLS